MWYFLLPRVRWIWIRPRTESRLSSMRQNCSLALLLAALGASAPALAQTRDPAAAEALFRQGRQAVEAQNYATACPKFAESQRLDPAVGTLMNWAACEEKLGKLASAWQRWREAIDALPPKDDRQTYAQQRVTEIEKRLPKLAVTLSGDSSAKVFRDEVELGPASLGVPLPVDPGEHVVVVRLPGHAAQRMTVSVAEAESKKIEVSPGPAEDTSVKVSPKGKTTKTLGFVAIGVGALGIGGGIATGLMINSARTTVRSSCVDKACDQAGLDAASRGKTLVPINIAAWAIGGLGLGAGAYLLITSSSGGSTTAVGASPLPGGAALSASGSF
jgi:hypothetical protein